MNCVCVIGRLTRDPEVRTTNTGKSVINFSLAVQKRFKPQNSNEPDADFFRCQAWGQPAEYLGNYASKGQRVSVTGRLETRKWTDNSGTNREVVEIVAEQVSILESRRDDDEGGGPRQQQQRYAPNPDEFDPFADQ